MSLRKDLKEGKLDLAALPSDKRARVTQFLAGDKRALHVRNKILGLRFKAEDVAAWHSKAKKARKSITEWIEETLNASK